MYFQLANNLEFSSIVTPQKTRINFYFSRNSSHKTTEKKTNLKIEQWLIIKAKIKVKDEREEEKEQKKIVNFAQQKKRGF